MTSGQAAPLEIAGLGPYLSAMNARCPRFLFVTLICWPLLGWSQTDAQKSDTPKSDFPWPELKVEVLLSGLNHPTGVAVQPGSNQVFFSESGAGRVVRLAGTTAQEVIVELPTLPLDEASGIQLGPLGLAFLDASTLVVGEGGKPAGEDRILVFKIEGSSKALKEADAQNRFALSGSAERAAEGNFSAVLIYNGHLYATCRGDDSKGWIARADRADQNLSNFRRYSASKDLGTVGNPLALAQSPEGFLAVALAGNFDATPDAHLAFLDEAGALKAQFQIGLHDVTGLAYGPKSGRLFALDLDWADPTQGGLYQLLESNVADRAEARLVLKLDRPTSAAFDSAGNLYVTVLGPAAPAQPPAGQLLKITGLDEKKSPQ